MTPVGKEVAKTIIAAIETTEKVRKAIGTAQTVVKNAQAIAKNGVPTTDALLNTGTQFARDRAQKQLAFFKNKAEADGIGALVAQTRLMTSALPQIPQIPGVSAE